MHGISSAQFNRLKPKDQQAILNFNKKKKANECAVIKKSTPPPPDVISDVMSDVLSEVSIKVPSDVALLRKKKNQIRE